MLTVTSSSSSKPGWLSYESSAATEAGCEAKPRDQRAGRERGRRGDRESAIVGVVGVVAAACIDVSVAAASGLSSRDAASKHRPLLLLRRPIRRIMVN